MTTTGSEPHLPRNPGPGNRRVLVVDDQPEVRMVIGKYLALTGFDITEAGDGRSALAAVSAGPPFLAMLTDLSLPDIDGRDLARQVLDSSPMTWVALLTGWSVEAEDYVPWGIHRVFAKPVNLAEVRRTLSALGTTPDPPPG